MRAYVDEFGLTQLRLYSTAAMAWLAIVFPWLALTVFRGHRRAFAPGAVAGALLVVIALNAINPDRVIVEANAANSGRPFDAGYAASLSPDATPTIIAKLAALSPGARCDLARELLSRETNDDWRSWNLSRAQAESTIDRHRAELEQACE